MTQVKLHIILQTPPAAIDYGLQKGAGSQYDTEQIQRSVGKDLHFTLTAEVKEGKAESSSPVLKSPSIQRGDPHNFIYIDIGIAAGQHGTDISRRLKIPIMGITWEKINQLQANDILQAVVPGIGKDGGPNCATVKPFTGWHIVKEGRRN